MSTGSKNRPVVFLFGPTGVGKTRFLAEYLPPGSEIVAVDSIQIYRGFDLGSAKPSTEERRRVPHHLIDIRDPDQPFDAGDFVREALAAIDAIHGRGRVPVLSGGTAYYFHTLVNGLPETPPARPDTRAAAAALWQERGEAGLRQELSRVDPQAEARILKGDAYRLQRAWEVWLTAGRPLSSFGRRTPPGLSIFAAGLDRPREELRRRLEDRVDLLLAQGLEAEVRTLVAAGWGPGHPAFRGIGYAEWFPWLSGGVGSLAEVRARIVVNSQRYAKRQLTFFRSLPGVRWYHPDAAPALLSDLRAWSLTNAPGWC